MSPDDEIVPIAGTPPIVVVCGGRHYSDRAFVEATLDKVSHHFPIAAVAHGAATGADELAGNWARKHRLQEILFPANWGSMGRYAGPVRNRIMLTILKPTLVVAFPGGAGTAGTVRLAKEQGIDVWDFNEPSDK